MATVKSETVMPMSRVSGGMKMPGSGAGPWPLSMTETPGGWAGRGAGRRVGLARWVSRLSFLLFLLFSCMFCLPGRAGASDERRPGGKRLSTRPALCRAIGAHAFCRAARAARGAMPGLPAVPRPPRKGYRHRSRHARGTRTLLNPFALPIRQGVIRWRGTPRRAPRSSLVAHAQATRRRTGWELVPSPGPELPARREPARHIGAAPPGVCPARAL